MHKNTVDYMNRICKNTNKTKDHNYITQSIKHLDHYKTHPNPPPINQHIPTPPLPQQDTYNLISIAIIPLNNHMIPNPPPITSLSTTPYLHTKKSI